MRFMWTPKSHPSEYWHKHQDEYGHKHHEDHEHEYEKHGMTKREKMLYSLDRTFDHAEEIVAHPPKTWEPWMNVPNGLWKIVEMEYDEAKAAHKALKDEVGTHAEFVKQLCHLIAAAGQAYATMTCDD